MKFIVYTVALAILGFGWMNHLQNKQSVTAVTELSSTINDNNISSDMLPELLENTKDGSQKKAIKELMAQLIGQETDVEETTEAATALAEDVDNSATFMGILLTFLTAGYAGILFVMHILPILAHRATHQIFDSGAQLEKDLMSDARSKVAQGDYEGAIQAFREAAEKDLGNRLPWVEIVKLQRDVLQVPAAAIETIREVLEKYTWQENDAAYFLFRLAELYDADMGERENAVSIMQQVMQQFPETRHSANARHKLHEWGVV